MVAAYPGFAITTTSPGMIAAPESLPGAAKTVGRLPDPAKTRRMAIRMIKLGLILK
jgi:hypothetical protein